MQTNGEFEVGFKSICFFKVLKKSSIQFLHFFQRLGISSSVQLKLTLPFVETCLLKFHSMSVIRLKNFFQFPKVHPSLLLFQ